MKSPWSQRFRSSRWPALLVATATGYGAACAEPSGAPEDGDIDTKRTASLFVAATMEGGGIGDDSWQNRGFEAPGVLVLEDSEGEERFELTPDEYRSLLDLVLSEEFMTAIRDPSACGSRPDGEMSVFVTWSDIGIQGDTSASACASDREGSDHPYTQFYWQIFDLKKKYLPCPPPPTPDETWDGVRLLCPSCGGLC